MATTLKIPGLDDAALKADDMPADVMQRAVTPQQDGWLDHILEALSQSMKLSIFVVEAVTSILIARDPAPKILVYYEEDRAVQLATFLMNVEGYKVVASHPCKTPGCLSIGPVRLKRQQAMMTRGAPEAPGV